jgi:hypothetical protein
VEVHDVADRVSRQPSDAAGPGRPFGQRRLAAPRRTPEQEQHPPSVADLATSVFELDLPELDTFGVDRLEAPSVFKAVREQHWLDEELRPAPIHRCSGERIPIRFFAIADPVARNDYSVEVLDQDGNVIEVPTSS